ncbi:MAG TPA: dienelactone hydrolase family protein [Acidimicrobiales bacterium]
MGFTEADDLAGAEFVGTDLHGAWFRESDLSEVRSAPDLFNGRTFDSIGAGVAHAEEIGFAELIDRGSRAAEELPNELVYAGFSLGLPAQKLAQTRAGAQGALLIHSCLAPAEFRHWPENVPVQVHAMDADPYFVDEGDLGAARSLVDAVTDAQLFLYPGSDHLFADPSLRSHDPEAAALLQQRVLEFLAAR